MVIVMMVVMMKMIMMVMTIQSAHTPHLRENGDCYIMYFKIEQKLSLSLTKSLSLQILIRPLRVHLRPSLTHFGKCNTKYLICETPCFKLRQQLLYWYANSASVKLL